VTQVASKRMPATRQRDRSRRAEAFDLLRFEQRIVRQLAARCDKPPSARFSVAGSRRRWRRILPTDDCHALYCLSAPSNRSWDPGPAQIECQRPLNSRTQSLGRRRRAQFRRAIETTAQVNRQTQRSPGQSRTFCQRDERQYGRLVTTQPRVQRCACQRFGTRAPPSKALR
jgi:hypothetical protein